MFSLPVSAAAVIAAAVVAATAAAAPASAAAAAAQDDDKDDDPQAAAATPAGTVIAAPHNEVPPEMKWRPAAGVCPDSFSCAASLHTMPHVLIGAGCGAIGRDRKINPRRFVRPPGVGYAILSVTTLSRTALTLAASSVPAAVRWLRRVPPDFIPASSA